MKGGVCDVVPLLAGRDGEEERQSGVLSAVVLRRVVRVSPVLYTGRCSVVLIPPLAAVVACQGRDPRACVLLVGMVSSRSFSPAAYRRQDPSSCRTKWL
jgi:hypothetical protein